MKYYSEKTKKYYDDEKSCISAEKEYDKAHALEVKKAEVRKEDAAKVTDLYKKYLSVWKEADETIKKARDAYLKAREDFINKYGSYHMTITSRDTIPSVQDFFRELWNLKF